MTTRWPTGCLHASSRITLHHEAFTRLLLTNQIGHFRRYAQNRNFKKIEKSDGITATPADPVKSALTIVESKAKVDPINPPRSTLPPPLTLPSRGEEATLVYWFRLGRAYGTFYKEGIKAVWFNWKAARLLKERMTGEREAIDVTNAVAERVITRSEFQLLARNSHDIGKLPLFGLLVVVFGEWLVFVVPFVPNTVPRTCRIPSQVLGMRMTAEERRRVSFRQGVTEPSSDQLPNQKLEGSSVQKDDSGAWPMAFSNGYRGTMVKKLRDDQLHHLSSTLGLHGRIWDRIQLPPPAFLLRLRINRRLQYISQDDALLLQSRGAARLTPDELHSACEERGLDILGKTDDILRQSLSWWLDRQQKDGGRGRALFAMLFRRLAIREWVQLNLDANRE